MNHETFIALSTNGWDVHITTIYGTAIIAVAIVTESGEVKIEESVTFDEADGVVDRLVNTLTNR